MKTVKIIALAVIVLVLLVVVLVPGFVSSGKCRQIILDKVNKSVQGKMDFASLSMGWLKGLTVRDFSFNDNAGTVFVKIKQISTKPCYGCLLLGDLAFGKTVVEQPRIELNLLEQQQSPKVAASAAPKPQPARAQAIVLPVSRIDLVVEDGDVKVTDKRNTAVPAQAVELSNINSEVNLQPAGSRTAFDVNMNVGQPGKESKISAKGAVTPPHAGWSLEGTSGELTIDVNDLDLGTLAPLLAMADPNIKMAGIITINGVAKLDNGKITGANAKINGSNLNISLPALKGDSFKTKMLAISANVSTDEKVTKIEKLDAMLDWASFAMKGILPTTVKSLDDLLSPTSPTELNGNLNIDLATMLSQMPHLAGLKEGTKINSGKLTGEIGTSAAAEGKMLDAKFVISDLQGIVSGKSVALSKPITLESKIGSQKGILNIDRFAVDSSFAQANVSGTTEALKYGINADLAAMQGELGQFVDFGAYKLGGQLGLNGNVAMKQKAIASDGSMTISQLAVASASGKATEPAATLAYKINLDQQANVLTIDSFKFETSFAKVNITDATVPIAANSSTPMKLSVAANADFAKAMPWMLMAGALKPPMQLGGMLDSTISVISRGNEFHIQTDATKITNLTVVTGPNQPPFKQAELAFNADMFVNPVEKTYKIQTFKLSSPGTINIELQKFRQTNEGKTTKLEGQIKADYDWQAVTAMAAPFLPAGLQLTGKRNDTITFNSQWPTNDANQMLANMTGSAALGWQSAEYMGLQMGQTEIKAQIQNGKLTIPPFTTTLNSGTLNFGANADFRKKPTLLTIPGTMNVLKDVQINDKVAAALLKNVNPIFASAKNTQGAATLECRELAIPLSGGTDKDTKIDATVSVLNLHLQSPVLEVLALLLQKNSNTNMTLHPSQFIMRNGILTYDNMQIDLGNLGLVFAGQMGPENKIKMSVTIPGLGGIAFKGTKDKPQLDPAKIATLTLQQQLLGGKQKQPAAQPGQQQPATQEQQLIKGLEGFLKKR